MRKTAPAHLVTVLPPVERPRVWGAVLAGLLIHALLIALVLWETRAVRPKRATDPDRATAPRQVEMVYLAPPSLTPPRSAVRPAVQPTRPPPELQQRDTRPPSRITRSPDTEPGNAAQASRTTPLASSGAPETASHPTSRRQPPSPAERSLASAAPKESEMESEARRLFGPRSAPTSDAGPAMRELATLGPAGNSATPSDCRPVPHPPRQAGTAPRMGSITGRILQRNTDRPLANAHLQMIGTPFVAFTDAGGWYTFRFDTDLVEDCRTQVVRVSAPGFRTQWLSVIVAPNAQNSDVRLDHGS